MSEAHATLEELLAEMAEAQGGERVRHATSCSACGERLALATRLHDAARLADIGDPSDALVTSTWQRIARQRVLDAAVERLVAAGTALRSVLAALAGDTCAPSHAVRGTATANARVLVFETDDVGISLALAEPTESGVGIRGQIMPRREEELPAPSRVLVAADDEAREVSIDEFGAFDLGTVTTDTLHVAFLIGDTRVELPPVSLRGNV